MESYFSIVKNFRAGKFTFLSKWQLYNLHYVNFYNCQNSENFLINCTHVINFDLYLYNWKWKINKLEPIRQMIFGITSFKQAVNSQSILCQSNYQIMRHNKMIILTDCSSTTFFLLCRMDCDMYRIQGAQKLLAIKEHIYISYLTQWIGLLVFFLFRRHDDSFNEIP